ncbi:hypothetical protein [Chroococcidiopsis sp. TS-821]|uniref:hypothetical protein n=1 Tax=Chroococcidiopsis sp. TS-821 TaxID=1378066 RepID=UPI0011B07364|nr:hypothetical protein [Chroococcidiopsis sp. TS-821]
MRTLPESFRSTNGMAAVASLGIHGLLLIVLPFLPYDSQLAANVQQRTVGIVELTPEEQSRLPGASSVPAALPSFATQPSPLPPLPPPPSFPVGALPPLPDPITLPPSIGLPPAGNNSLQALQPNQTFILPVSPERSNRTTSGVPKVNPSQSTQQAFATGSTTNTPPPPPVLNTLPPPPPLGNLQPPVAAAPNQSQNRTFNSSELLPPVPQWQQPRNTGLPEMRLNPAEPFSPNEVPTPQVAQTLPTSPNLVQPQQPQNEPQQPQPQSQPQQQVAAANPTQPVESGPRPQQLPERGKQELLALQQKIREERAAATNPAVNVAPQTAVNPQPVEPHTAEPTRQQLVAALRSQQTTASDSSTPAQPDTTAEQEQTRRQQLVAALRSQQTTASGSSSNSSATSDRDAQLQAWENRQNTIQQNYSNVVTKAPIYKTIKSCDRRLEGVAVLGVVVNPEGRIVSGPDFLSRQGAAGVEQAAKEYVQAYEFPKSESAVNQQFHLQYQYDTANCAQPSEAPNTPEPPQQSDA